jgi:hypothetical protein
MIVVEVGGYPRFRTLPYQSDSLLHLVLVGDTLAGSKALLAIQYFVA